MDKCSDVIVSTNSMEQKLLESPSKKKRLLMHTRKRRRSPSIQSLPMLEETEEQDPLPYDIDVSRKKEKDVNDDMVKAAGSRWVQVACDCVLWLNGSPWGMEVFQLNDDDDFLLYCN
ncbi:hypothetical protein MSG28_013589 [Choristoneura fumiferana]|uniref:Uncharacterized protein n=1 Tax=Choristoneura fumiferana TaxID=7141 RepID=A0ACC0K8N1_CHOFU|nr:hypothetical protein MSG28_013589 [Choristoneura fumiferana]